MNNICIKYFKKEENTKETTYTVIISWNDLLRGKTDENQCFINSFKIYLRSKKKNVLSYIYKNNFFFYKNVNVLWIVLCFVFILIRLQSIAIIIYANESSEIQNNFEIYYSLYYIYIFTASQKTTFEFISRHF